MESLGEYLKTQREKKSIRLEEIASITKIQLHNLELLEKGSWESLPPEPFIRGFILAYAKYVGLNARDVIQKYEKELGASAPPPPVTPETGTDEDFDEQDEASDVPPEQLVESMKPPPTKKIAFAVVGIIGFLIVARLSLFGKKVSEEATKTDAVATASEPVAGTTPEANAAVTEPAKPADAASAAVAVAPTPAENAPPSPLPPELTANASERIIASQKEIPGASTASAPAIPANDPEFKHTVQVTVQERSWSKVVIDEEKPVEKILAKGEKLDLKAKSKIKVVLGNSTGAEFLHNGEPSEGKVYQGTIRYYIFPQGARFPQDKPKPRAVTSEDNSEGTSTEDSSANDD